MTGITIGPGKVKERAFSGFWKRDLDTDLAAAGLLVELGEDPESAIRRVRAGVQGGNSG
ncbi:MAG: hypothetical protein WCQ50_05990 [Spirochaetota bacterium]